MGDVSSIPGSGRSPGGGHGNPLQYSCLEDIMDRGAWWATVQGVTKSWTWLKWLSTHAHLLNLCCWWCLQFEGSLNITKQWWLLIFSYLFLKTPVGPATRKTLAYKSIFPFKISPPQYWMYSKSSWLLLAKPRFKICLQVPSRSSTTGPLMIRALSWSWSGFLPSFPALPSFCSVSGRWGWGADLCRLYFKDLCVICFLAGQG